MGSLSQLWGEDEHERGYQEVEITVTVLACICTGICWLITLAGISEHLTHWNSPAHQRIVIQMLALVLVWSLFACLVVVRPQVVLLTKLFMDTYEAYIVVLFMELMTVYLGGRKQTREFISKMPPYKLFWLHLQPTPRKYRVIQAMIFQFVLVKPACSLLRCILFYVGRNRPTSELGLQVVLPLLRVLTMVSLITAMMGLLAFYKMFSPILTSYKVASKFLALKVFIFLHIAQGVIIEYFSTPETHYLFYQIEYTLLCSEMVVAATLNKSVTFTFREFLTETTPIKPFYDYLRLDRGRLAEWKTVMANPFFKPEDSMFPESIPSASVLRTRSLHFDRDCCEYSSSPLQRFQA